MAVAFPVQGLPSLVPHPFVYLLFHLANAHFIARILPFKKVTYPCYFALAVIQFMFEHQAGQLEALGLFVLGAPVNAVIFASIIVFYYEVYQKGSQMTFCTSVGCFVLQVATFIALQGPPPVTVEESLAANENDDYLKWHLLGHVLFMVNVGVASQHTVPWDDSKGKPKKA